jgi:peptidoglycan hydrolase-like protein with peptidoglycan-binding domain
MGTDRTMMALLGLGAVLAAAGSASASAPARRVVHSSAPKKPSAPKKKRASSSAPEGEVTLGPITQIRTDPKTGVVTKSTDLRSLTPKELATWQVSEAKAGRGNITDLLTDEQAEAMESASVETARAAMPGASADQHARALRAAQRARELLGGKKTTAKPPRTPSNPSIDTRDDLPTGKETPKAYVSPPTPINLELARKEAPKLAQHLRTKGRAGYSRQSLRAFQGHAGITVDGIYGPLSASALRFFGVSNPPAAFFAPKPGTVTIYAPAN